MPCAGGGPDLRHAEMVEAARCLGLPDTSLPQLRYDDQTLTGHEDELVNVVRDSSWSRGPEEIYVTGALESHACHSAVGRAVRQAVRLMPAPPALLDYPNLGVVPTLGRRHHRAVAQPNRRRADRRRPVAVRMHAGQGASAEFVAARPHAVDAHGSQQNRLAGVPRRRTMVGPTQADPGSGKAYSVELFLPHGPRARPDP
jgi:LmbE family N-acetylglucosaminyl deacetylase